MKIPYLKIYSTKLCVIRTKIKHTAFKDSIDINVLVPAFLKADVTVLRFLPSSY